METAILETDLANMALVLAISPIALIVINYLKNNFSLSTKYTGLAGLICGLLFAFGKNPVLTLDAILTNIATALVVAATASGTYSQYKNMKKGEK
jgi:hypothetical protein